MGSDGSKVGTIESVTSGGIIVTTGRARVQIPAASIGKNESGLMVGMTKAELEASAAKAAPNS
jgi:hypothetical protein